jgi:hypothetical protein
MVKTTSATMEEAARSKKLRLEQCPYFRKIRKTDDVKMHSKTL